MMRLKNKYGIFIIIITLTAFLTPVSANDDPKEYYNNTICGIYFTGVGCPHCAVADPVILEDYPGNYSNFVIIEYEIYQTPENGNVLNRYISKVGAGTGIPQMLIEDEFEKGEYTSGGGPTTSWTEKKLKNINSAQCKLSDGSEVKFEGLNINSLPGRPKIWTGNRILIKTEENKEKFETTEAEPVKISGGEISFENAVRFGKWILQWNGEKIKNFTYSYERPLSENKTVFIESKRFLKEVLISEDIPKTLTTASQNYDRIVGKEGSEFTDVRSDLTPEKAIELALADAVNPCAIAVMIIMLTAIINYNPEDKKKVLFAGLAFVLSVYFTYLFYGLVIINLLKFVQTLFASLKPLIYLIVGLFAAGLGIMNIMDYINYEPGGFLTEMPMFLRPKMKKVLEGVTSPKGAAVTGIFVTLFLLPCTIGPYIAALGMLSFFELLETLPWLLFYNVIFVSPMIAITLLIYRGAAEVEDISKWRDKNIRYLHLGAGIVIFGVGACMIFNLLEWVYMIWPLIFGIAIPCFRQRLEI